MKTNKTMKTANQSQGQSQAQVGQGQAPSRIERRSSAVSSTLRGLIESPQFQRELLKLVPSPQRFARVAVNQLLRNPQLAECDRSSFINCLLQAAQFGLEPNGRDAHLIPFRDSRSGRSICTLILDYKGLVKLAMKSGQYRRIFADVVRDNDEFVYNLGQIQKHTYDLRKDRGEVIAFYAFAETPDGAQTAVVMTDAEVEAVRRRSRAGNSGPWVTDRIEMGKKTAFRRLSKWLVLGQEVEDAIAQDAEAEFGSSIADAIDVPMAEVAEPPPAPPPAPAQTQAQDSAGDGDKATPAGTQDEQMSKHTVPATDAGGQRASDDELFG